MTAPAQDFNAPNGFQAWSNSPVPEKGNPIGHHYVWTWAAYNRDYHRRALMMAKATGANTIKPVGMLQAVCGGFNTSGRISSAWTTMAAYQQAWADCIDDCIALGLRVYAILHWWEPSCGFGQVPFSDVATYGAQWAEVLTPERAANVIAVDLIAEANGAASIYESILPQSPAQVRAGVQLVYEALRPVVDASIPLTYSSTENVAASASNGNADIFPWANLLAFQVFPGLNPTLTASDLSTARAAFDDKAAWISEIDALPYMLDDGNDVGYYDNAMTAARAHGGAGIWSIHDAGHNAVDDNFGLWGQSGSSDFTPRDARIRSFVRGRSTATQLAPPASLHALDAATSGLALTGSGASGFVAAEPPAITNYQSTRIYRNGALAQDASHGLYVEPGGLAGKAIHFAASTVNQSGQESDKIELIHPGRGTRKAYRARGLKPTFR